MIYVDFTPKACNSAQQREKTHMSESQSFKAYHSGARQSAWDQLNMSREREIFRLNPKDKFFSSIFGKRLFF